MIHEPQTTREDDAIIALTEAELTFRSSLLLAAERLDVPSREGELRCYSQLVGANRSTSLRRVGRLHASVMIVSAVGMAAAAALWLSVGRPELRPAVVRAEVLDALSVTHSASSAAPASTTAREPLVVKVPVAKVTKTRLMAPAAAARPTTSATVVEGAIIPTIAEERIAEPAVPSDADTAMAVAAPGSLMVWDGDRTGLSASGWTGPKNEPKKLGVFPNAGVDGSKGIVWQAEGSNWIGFGWNWFSWYPKDAGTDISAFQWLVFKLRLVAVNAGECAEPKSLIVTLSSSQGKEPRSTNGLNLTRVAPADICDGQWHTLRVPLAELLLGSEARGFDQRKVWEFMFGHWSTDRRQFTAYLDDIGFER